MKRYFISSCLLVILFAACKKADFADAYKAPDGIEQTTVEKQYAGFLGSNLEYVVPNYWNYFVVLRTTLKPYTQSVGYINAPNQYLPGQAAIGARWGSYYQALAQYREMEKVYNTLGDAKKKELRIFVITGGIYLYDFTAQLVDLHGDIPFSKAGLLSANGGEYSKSLAAYDKAEDIYTKILDDLKSFSDELNTISLSSAVATSFKTQDFISSGNITLWKKYCNSLRLRLLTRVSDNATFQARAAAEIAAILGNSASYPVIDDNNDNVQINVSSATTYNANGFRTGLEDWGGNMAGKVMIDHMNTNADPRLRVMFEPGEKAGGVYTGLDPLMADAAQNTLVSDGKIAFYNRSTLSRNINFPGVLANAAEVSFYKAEAYLKAGNATAAKQAYNNGISQSVKYYYALRSLSTDNSAGSVTPATDAEIATYQGKAAVNWDNAATNADKMKLIATQKWIHYSVIQCSESWAEIRRLEAPALTFQVDNSNAQKQPPVRWYYPGEEATFNTDNYNAVKAKDNLTTKVFWDK